MVCYCIFPTITFINNQNIYSGSDDCGNSTQYNYWQEGFPSNTEGDRCAVVMYSTTGNITTSILQDYPCDQYGHNFICNLNPTLQPTNQPTATPEEEITIYAQNQKISTTAIVTKGMKQHFFH